MHKQFSHNGMPLSSCQLPSFFLKFLLRAFWHPCLQTSLFSGQTSILDSVTPQGLLFCWHTCHSHMTVLLEGREDYILSVFVTLAQEFKVCWMNDLDAFGLCVLLWVDEHTLILYNYWHYQSHVWACFLYILNRSLDSYWIHWQVIDGLLRAWSGFIHTYLKEIHLRTRMHWSGKLSKLLFSWNSRDIDRDAHSAPGNSAFICAKATFLKPCLDSLHPLIPLINRWKVLMGFRRFYPQCLTSWLRPKYLWTEDNSKPSILSSLDHMTFYGYSHHSESN